MENPFRTIEDLEAKGELDEIRAYLSGRIDFDAVEDYLRHPSPQDLATIAAQLRSRETDASEPRELIASAAELLREAQSHTEHQRLKTVAGMNRVTLVELATRMGIIDAYDGSKAEAIQDWSYLSNHRYDPGQRPVIMRLGDMDWKAHAVADGNLTVKNPERLLEFADLRTSLPRPPLGSTLNDSLRWAVNEPRTSKKNLRAAFVDCVRYSLAQQWLEPMNDLEDAVGKDEALAISHYVKNFEPGITVPDYIELHAPGEISEHWEPLFVTPGKLAWLSQTFRSFWEKHGTAYSKRSLAKDEKGLHTKRKIAGKKGATNRENRAYMTHSRSLVTFLDTMQIPRDGDARRLLFNNFARLHVKTRTKEAQANLVDFFNILYVHREEEPHAVLGWLHKHRLLKFSERPDEERKRIDSKMERHEKSQLKRGHAPRTLLRGWSFDVDGVRLCLDILRPVFETKAGPWRKA